MIARQEWFGRRKYTGWGLSPRTWQGWAYILVTIALAVGISNLTFLDKTLRFSLIGVIVAVIIVDVVHIMLTMKHDERDALHEAIAERNALWAMIAVLAIGIAYQAMTSAMSQKPAIDPFVAAALASAVLVKGISNFILERRN